MKMTMDDLINEALEGLTEEKIEAKYRLEKGFIEKHPDLLEVYRRYYYCGSVRREQAKHFSSLHDAKSGRSNFNIPGGGGFVNGWNK
ncbi:MAG: hypothetical protein WAX69_15290 [Victivallales bacterium]